MPIKLWTKCYYMLKSFCLNFDGMYLSIVSFLSEKFNLKRVGKMELESKEDYEETTHHNVASSVVTATHDNLDGREFFELCSNPALVFSFETHKKFNELPVDSKESPLDLFIANTKQLHLLRSGDISNTLSHLLLLGYVSAAESYLRALIRNLINHDEYIQSIVSG